MNIQSGYGDWLPLQRKDIHVNLEPVKEVVKSDKAKEQLVDKAIMFEVDKDSGELVTKFTRADGTKVQIPTEEAIRYHKRISDYLDKVGKAVMGNIVDVRV
jgi:uncharacterized FlaG/YvyC family protein